MSHTAAGARNLGKAMRTPVHCGTPRGIRYMSITAGHRGCRRGTTLSLVICCLQCCDALTMNWLCPHSSRGIILSPSKRRPGMTPRPCNWSCFLSAVFVFVSSHIHYFLPFSFPVISDFCLGTTNCFMFYIFHFNIHTCT